MSRTARFDWRDWRLAIAERLDRQTITAAIGFALFLVTFSSLAGFGPIDTRRFVLTAAFHFSAVAVTLVTVTVAMVAVARGASRWFAYPFAACIATLATLVAGVVIDPNNWLFKMASPRWVALSYALGMTMLAVPAVVYVVQSNAAQSANALRRLENERAAEAERLAHQRLQAQLATIDHDLVLMAMRLARASPPARAESLLATLSAYLRAAQQRESTDAARVAATLAELRAMCASPASGAAQEVVA